MRSRAKGCQEPRSLDSRERAQQSLTRTRTRTRTHTRHRPGQGTHTTCTCAPVYLPSCLPPTRSPLPLSSRAPNSPPPLVDLPPPASPSPPPPQPSRSAPLRGMDYAVAPSGAGQFAFDADSSGSSGEGGGSSSSDSHSSPADSSYSAVSTHDWAVDFSALGAAAAAVAGRGPGHPAAAFTHHHHLASSSSPGATAFKLAPHHQAHPQQQQQHGMASPRDLWSPPSAHAASFAAGSSASADSPAAVPQEANGARDYFGHAAGMRNGTQDERVGMDFDDMVHEDVCGCVVLSSPPPRTSCLLPRVTVRARSRDTDGRELTRCRASVCSSLSLSPQSIDPHLAHRDGAHPTLCAGLHPRRTCHCSQRLPPSRRRVGTGPCTSPLDPDRPLRRQRRHRPRPHLCPDSLAASVARDRVPDARHDFLRALDPRLERRALARERRRRGGHPRREPVAPQRCLVFVLWRWRRSSGLDAQHGDGCSSRRSQGRAPQRSRQLGQPRRARRRPGRAPHPDTRDAPCARHQWRRARRPRRADRGCQVARRDADQDQPCAGAAAG